jgi:hypothetical protein
MQVNKDTSLNQQSSLVLDLCDLAEKDEEIEFFIQYLKKGYIFRENYSINTLISCSKTRRPKLVSYHINMPAIYNIIS